jgi:hypothetical protein
LPIDRIALPIDRITLPIDRITLPIDSVLAKGQRQEISTSPRPQPLLVRLPSVPKMVENGVFLHIVV